MAVWWLMVKLAAKHSRVGKVWLHITWLQHHIGSAWTQPQDSGIAFTAPTAALPSGFLAPCLAVPVYSMEHRGERKAGGFLNTCVVCGKQAISSTLSTCGKVIHRVLTIYF